MTVVGIIPARGGSKGIHRKNLVKIGSTPLIGLTILAAKKARSIDKIIVSSDDEEIMQVARYYGAETPFIRPKNISLDSTKMIEVLKHALLFLNNSKTKTNAIVLLQPTSPLRNEIHIEESLELFFRMKASSIVSVVEVPHQYNPHSILYLNKSGRLERNSKINFTRRQEKPKFYARNGPSILITDPKVIMDDELYGDNSYPYIMSKEDSLDIDTLSDLEEAKRILEKQKNNI